jgi:hypothetical protein
MPFSISFRRARDVSDATLAVQATDDLTGVWTNIWSSATNAYGGGTNDFETTTVSDPQAVKDTAVGRFLRLDVTRP